MGADHRVVPAIKQALSMLGQAREALLFAQCPTAVAKVRRAIKSTEGALRTAKRRAIQPGRPFSRASDGAAPLSPGDDKSIARHLRLTLRQVRSGDYRVNFRDGNETTAYYTDNLEDAVNTAVEMARKRALRAEPCRVGT
jgi:hypothetical protein